MERLTLQDYMNVFPTLGIICSAYLLAIRQCSYCMSLRTHLQATRKAWRSAPPMLPTKKALSPDKAEVLIFQYINLVCASLFLPPC